VSVILFWKVLCICTASCHTRTKETQLSLRVFETPLLARKLGCNLLVGTKLDLIPE
jgi:hypothetical protein